MKTELRIHEQRLPGIGRRYEVVLDRDQRLVLVIQPDGRREIGLFTSGSDGPEAVASLSHDQALAVAALLTGARFTVDAGPGDPDDADAAVDTVMLGAASPAIGPTPMDGLNSDVADGNAEAAAEDRLHRNRSRVAEVGVAT
jgi:K+/H+ antiporter YhaU regulatory subunit KhtT